MMDTIQPINIISGVWYKSSDDRYYNLKYYGFLKYDENEREIAAMISSYFGGEIIELDIEKDLAYDLIEILIKEIQKNEISIFDGKAYIKNWRKKSKEA